MENKSIIIIGAGIAGLATGCYARMNDYKTQIFEMHTSPGGVCACWNRKGYSIDGGMHWLSGTQSTSNFYKIWEELGAIQNREILYFNNLGSYESINGQIFVLHTNLERLETHMLELAPEDKEQIKEFILAAKEIGKFELPIDKAPELLSIKEKIDFAKDFYQVGKVLMKWGKTSVAEFANKFKASIIKEAFQELWVPELSMFSLLLAISWAERRVAGYHVGGSLGFVKSIEKRFLDLDGILILEIFIKKQRAVS